MKRLLLWAAVPLMVLGAAILTADSGATGPMDRRDRGRYRTDRHRPGEAECDGTTVTLLA